MRTAASYFQDPATFATVLAALMVDKFDSKWMEWEPETRSDTIHEIYGFVPPETVCDKLSSVATLLTTNQFNTNLQAFIPMCNALCSETVDPDAFFPADLDNVVWGVSEAQLLYGSDLLREGYSEEIKRYVGALLAEKSMYAAPTNISWATFPPDYRPPTVDMFAENAEYTAFLGRQTEEKNELMMKTVHRFEALAKQLKELPIKGMNMQVVTAIEDMVKGLRQ